MSKAEIPQTSEKPTQTQEQDLSQPITIYEGKERSNRLAKAGDTFVKADGTQVVLTADPVAGVVGYGQGVAPDIGLIEMVGQGEQATPHTLKGNDRLVTNKYGNDSLGNWVAASFYILLIFLIEILYIFSVPVARILYDTFLRFIININQAEPLGVA